MKYKLFAKIIKPLILTVVIFGSFFASNFASASIDLTSGLVAHYKMDDTNGTTILDSTSNHYDGSGGYTANSNGKIDGAGQFNGNNTINLGNNFRYGYDQDVSLSAWVKVNSFAPDTIGFIAGQAAAPPGQCNYSFEYFLSFDNNTRKASFAAGKNCVGDLGAESLSTIEPGVWHHYVGVYSGQNIRLYIDGVLQDTTPYTYGAVNPPLGAGFMGNVASASWINFNGLIDDVRVYNRALNADEINVLGNSIHLDDGLVAHYKMNDNLSTTAVVDSVSGIDGTFQQNTSAASVAGVSANTTPVSGHGALSFNGSSDIVNAGTANTFSFVNQGTFSLSTWVKFSNYTQTTFIMGNVGSGDQTGFYLNWDGTAFNFYVGRSDSADYTITSGAGLIADNNWHHIMIIGNGSTATFYVDGVVSTGTGSVVFGGEDASNILAIGGLNWRDGILHFNGSMDDVRIYNRAINADEIIELRNNGNGTELGDPLDLNNGLVGHFRLDDNSADTAVINSNGETNGTANFNTSANSVAGVSVSTTPVSGHGALSFNGSSDYVNLGTNSFVRSASVISLSFWVKTSVTDQGYKILSSYYGDGGGTRDGYAIGTNGDCHPQLVTFAGDWYNYAYYDGSTSICDGNWHHLVFSWTGADYTSTKIYVDGNPDSVTNTINGTPNTIVYTDATPTTIGGYSGSGGTPGYFFSGSLDDFRFYNRVLNVGEVGALYNGGDGTQLGDMPGGEVAHWTMNDSAASKTVIDTTGDHNGTATQRNTSDMSIVGLIKNAFNFINNEFITASAPSLPGDFTVNTWIKTTASSMPISVSFPGGSYASGAFDLGWWPSDSNLGISGYFGGCDYPTNRISLDMTSVNHADGNWHMVTAILDTNTKKLRGLVDNGNTFSGEVDVPGSGILCTPTGIEIGARSDASWYYSGAIDDTRIYNKVLTQAELDQLWNNGAGTEAGRSWGGGSSIPIVTTKYWVGSGNWSDPANWGAISGGSGGVAVPIPGDTIIFDGGNSRDCYIDVDTTVDNIQIQDGYYGSIYQNNSIVITTTNSITQGSYTGAFYGGYYGTLSTGGNITFYNFYSYYTNISASGSVSVSTNYGEIHLNNLYAGNGTSLHTNYGSVYVNDWNSWGMYDSVYAGAYVDVRSSYSISLYSVYSGQGVNMSSSYGNIYVNDWYSSGYYNSVYAPSGYITLSSYWNSVSLYSAYSGQGTSLSSYYGDINVQIFDGSGYYNSVSTSYGSVNLANPYGNIYLYSLSAGYNATLTTPYTVYENYSFSVMGTLYMSGSFYNGGYGVSGSVEFTGTGDSYISGNTSFSGSFTCNQPSKHLYFANGQTQTITGEFHIAGDGSNPVYLMSQSVGNQWYIDPQSTRSVDYAWVQDSNNVNATSIDQTNSTDGGNNINWTFVTVPTCVVAPDDPLYTLCTYINSDTFVVPTGVTTAQVYAWGAGGGGGTVGGWSYGAPGGAGGAARGTVTLIPGGSYPIVVGGKGIVNSVSGAEGGGGAASNGSDNRYGSGGGGYSGLFLNSVSQENAVIIAGGGGGGASSRAGEGNAGGAGGGESGQVGYSPYDGKSAYGGNPGTQYSAGGAPSDQCGNSGGGQGALQGGIPYCNSYGGGGGGGYFGGSGGGYSESNTMGGGGGGSGYYNPSSVSSAVLTTGSGTTPGDSTNSLRGTAGNAGAVAGNGSNGSVVIKYLTPLGNGLVAHYKMNDNLSTVSVVENKNGYNGTSTQNTSAMHVAGKIGGALVFNGTGDYVSVVDNSSLQPDDMTLSAWIYPTNIEGNKVGVIEKRGGGDGTVDYNLDVYGNHVRFILGDGSAAVVSMSADNSIQNNNWYLVTAIVSGTTMQTYINGVASGAPTTFSGTRQHSSENLGIGLLYNGDTGYQFQGSIDDVRIYNRALGAADVAALYNWGDGTEDDGSAAITVSGAGTQIATTTIPVTGQNLGGAFLLTSTINNATTTSIRLKNTGSLSTSTISNIVLTYKDAVGGQCSSTKPLGTTSFGTAGAFDANGFATTTGTIPLNQDIPVCVYINYNLTGSFSTSSLGSSIDFEIVNPSADIVTTGGIVSTSNSVGIPNQTIVVNDASENPEANPTSCTNSGITSLLSLKMKDPAKNPTVFYLENCAVWKIVGGGVPVRLTSPNLQVHSLDFTNLTGANSGGSVRINMSMSNVDASSTPSYINTSKTYSTTATVKSWGGGN